MLHPLISFYIHLIYIRWFGTRKQVKQAISQAFFSNLFDETMRDFLLNFVKIILLKSDNCALTLRKRLFCDAKPTLLPCKTAAFGTQNNRFCNALMVRSLSDRYVCEKYLHLYWFLFVHKITWNWCKNWKKILHFFLMISISNHNQFFL